MTMHEEYPAVQWAYDFVLPSYDWALRRFDAIQGKIQNIMAVSTAVIVGVPALESGSPDFTSHWFLLALAYFAVLLGYGLFARSSESVRLLHPGELYANYLDCSEWKFKQSMIFYAAENYDLNRARVEQKWALLNCMIILFVLQVGFLLAWLWLP